MNTFALIVDSQWPTQGPSATWMLLNDSGKLVRSGVGPPEQWSPEAAGLRGVHLIVAGSGVACQQLLLPRSERGIQPDVMAAALENRVLEAPENLLLVPLGAPDPQGLRSVAIWAKNSMAQARQALLAQDLPVLSAWPLGAVLAPGQVVVNGSCASYGLASGGFISLELDDPLAGQAPELAGLALQHLELESLAPMIAQRCLAGPGFCYGEFAPPQARTAWGSALRPAAWASAVMLTLLVMVATGQWLWGAWQLHRSQAHMEQLFRQAIPQGTMVDPLLQMNRLVAEARHQQGESNPGDFLPLMGALLDMPPTENRQVRAIHYSGDALTISADLPEAAAQAFMQAARQRGLRVTQGPARDEFTVVPGGPW